MRRAARSLRVTVLAATVLAYLTSVALALAVLAAPLSVSQRINLGLIALLVIATIGWVVWSVARTRLPETIGVDVSQAVAPGLTQLAKDSAATLGGEPPARLIVSPAPQARVDVTSGRPVLVIGGPLLWALGEEQLRAVMVQELATIPWLCAKSVRSALMTGWRIRRCALDRNESPLLGIPLRVVARLVARQTARLEDACERAAQNDLRTRGLQTRSEIASKVADVEEVWVWLLSTWAVPAWQHDTIPVQLSAGTRAITSHLELVEAGADRAFDMNTTPVTRGLLTDPASLDRELSLLTAQSADRPDLQTITWAEYPDKVLAPQQRSRAARLVAAIDLATGRSQPATIEAILDCLDTGWATTVGAVLTSGEAESEDAEQRATEALVVHLHAAVGLALVESSPARWAIDWLFSEPEVRLGTQSVPILEPVQAAASGRGSDTLRGLLASLGVDLSAPLWVSDTASTASYPDVIAPVRFEGRRGYLVLAGPRLAIVKRSAFIRPQIGVLVGQPFIDPRAELFETSIDQLLGQRQVLLTRSTADVVSAHLTTRRSGSRWTCRMATSDSNRTFRGHGSGFRVYQHLSAQLGERLHSRGPIADDVLDSNGRSSLARVALWIGSACLLVACFFAFTYTADSHTAVVVSCAPNGVDTADWDCRAKLDQGRGPEETTVGSVRALAPGTEVAVRVVQVPLIGELVIEDRESESGLVTTAAVGLAIIGIALPFYWRRNRRRASVRTWL